MPDDLKTLNLVKPKIDALKARLGANFTAIFNQVPQLIGKRFINFPISQMNPVMTPPTPQQLASSLAYLSFITGVDTLITPMVDTNWVNPTTG